jgi:hypothetical protein
MVAFSGRADATVALSAVCFWQLRVGSVSAAANVRASHREVRISINLELLAKPFPYFSPLACYDVVAQDSVLNAFVREMGQ